MGTAAHAHFALACPNFSYLEGRESPGEDLDIFNWDVYPTMPKREGDRLYVADAAGLGVEVNEEMLREHDSPYAAPAVTRPDGSVTNC